MEIRTTIQCKLKSICYIKTVLTLIKKSAGKSLLSAPSSAEICDKHELAFERLQSLLLPSALKKELNLILHKIFSEIKHLWIIEQYSIGIGEVDFLQIRHWNLDGSLNKRRLAKSIIESTHLPNSRAFVLACNFCLQDEAMFYWDQMVEEERRNVLTSPAPGFSWTVMPSIVRLANLDKNLYMDLYIGIKGHYDDDLEALTYRLQTMEREEKILLVMKTARIRNIEPEVMRFCLSLLDEHQQREVCINNPYGVLRSLLTWPYYRQFHPVANFLWEHLTESDFCRLLSVIISYLERWPEPEHLQLLKGFFEASPKHFQKYALKRSAYGRFLDFKDSVFGVTNETVLRVFPVWKNDWNKFQVLVDC